MRQTPENARSAGKVETDWQRRRQAAAGQEVDRTTACHRQRASKLSKVKNHSRRRRRSNRSPSAQDREKRHHHHRHQHENNPEFEDADTVDAAYTWFSRIDADGSGRISVREVARILAGHMEYQFDVTFPMADTGLTFGNDEHNHLRIVDIEHESPADLHPDMMRGLTLTRVNGEELGTDKKNLLKLNKFLRGIEDGIPTRFSFTEPSFIVSEYGNMIDIRLHDDHDGGLHSVRMPPGAYTYDAEFVSTLETKIHETHEDLRFIKVHYNRKTHRISFKAADHKTEFMLCFKHGPHHQTSMHPVLAMDDADYPFEHHHTGHERAIQMDLGLTGTQVHVLAKEIMACYDTNNNLLFEFEEFVKLYRAYLVDDEARARLKKYSERRFRSKEEWARLREQRKMEQKTARRIARMIK